MLNKFFPFPCGLTSVYEQMNLSEDIMQGQTFQSLELEDFWEECVEEFLNWTGVSGCLV